MSYYRWYNDFGQARKNERGVYDVKSACVVFGKIADTWKGVPSIVNEFAVGGYEMEEISILTDVDRSKLQEILRGWREVYETIVFLVSKIGLLNAQQDITNCFSDYVCQASFQGAGVFSSGQKNVILLAFDEDCTGRRYAVEVCLPYLYAKNGARLDKTVIRAMGANETLVTQLLAQAQMRSGGKMKISRTRNFGEDVITIGYNDATPKMLIDDVNRVFAEGLGESIYALEDISLEEQLIRLLKLRGKKISVAESFTGGGIAKRLVSVSGASEVYFEGLNTYHEDSKIKRLGVAPYTLKTMGAVSDQTAYEMANGLLHTGDCDFAIATTGLAGPKSDKTLLPVGLCYIAVGSKERVFVYRYKFDGNREEITETAIRYALFLAYKHLKDV